MKEKEQLDKIKERVIESIAQNMNLYGVTPSIGRLYGLLYFEDEPLTLDEMKEELCMSKTSMSTSVRTLLDLKMVDKVWKKGFRKDLYEAEEDWYQTFIDLFTIKWRAGSSLNIQAIEKSLKELHSIIEDPTLEQEMKTTAESYKNKLTNALHYYQWLNRLVNTFESKEIFDYVPKTEDLNKQ